MKFVKKLLKKPSNVASSKVPAKSAGRPGDSLLSFR